MISVVIPLYNKEAQVGKTLKSILNQTFQDYEIVIVNDGSTDNSVDVVRNYSDPRIRLINQPNGGVSSARNRGIQEARGEYIALMDADDEWLPNYLKTQIELTLQFPTCKVFAVNYKFRDHNGRESYTQINKLPFPGDRGILTNYFEVAACSNPPICSISIMASKDAFLSIGGFPLGIKSGEDLLTWARLAARYNIAYCSKPVAIFNVEGYDIAERPKRIPAENDIVGQELMKLAKEFNPPFIKQYLSLWHKMRSSIYMRLNMRSRSISEAVKGLKFNPFNYKLYAFIIINCLPQKFKPF
ncbi:MAG: glycosyltransferase family 2 protein [Bacteroides sp.]|nr:glycosyltransferase family 2 protein [Bacteroides sp.]